MTVDCPRVTVTVLTAPGRLYVTVERPRVIVCICVDCPRVIVSVLTAPV